MERSFEEEDNLFISLIPKLKRSLDYKIYYSENKNYDRSYINDIIHDSFLIYRRYIKNIQKQIDKEHLEAIIKKITTDRFYNILSGKEKPRYFDIYLFNDNVAFICNLDVDRTFYTEELDICSKIDLNNIIHKYKDNKLFRYVVNGYSQKEIAKEYNLHNSNISIRLSRLRKEIKNLY